MIISKENSTLQLEVDPKSIIDSKDFCDVFSKEALGFDVILDVLQVSNLDDHLEQLKMIFNAFLQEEHSLIFVALPDQYDDLPEEFVLVPSLQEACDFVELDRIQRELGF